MSADFDEDTHNFWFLSYLKGSSVTHWQTHGTTEYPLCNTLHGISLLIVSLLEFIEQLSGVNYVYMIFIFIWFVADLVSGKLSIK